MLDMEHSSKSAGCNWWREVTGDCSVHLSEYIESGTPANAYGPDELIEELADLTAQAIECAEKGMRSSSGERELPALARDAFCMGRLGEFYVERLRAALCHGRANDVEALEHMARALGLYREIKSVDMSHRRRFRAGVGRCGRLLSWLDTIRALEAEYHDVRSGDFRFGAAYPFHVTNDNS
ncbi:MAG: hypothetical protein A2Z18_03080 [Armatimonadetes bacterium RBG_16_58_9]|nr:MAG: hypothetical protein A2Z18_03080 [Armatimonadetes bacterium RBG_16_58_9]